MAKVINMTDAEKARWKSVLVPYYREKGKSEVEIEETIDSVFAQAQSGWERAPRDLDTRIKMKTGYHWQSHENLKPNKEKKEEKEEERPEEDTYANNLHSFMNKTEQEWWADREKMYNGDFEFNKSSDKPLIEQLLVEELIQQRLFKMQVRYPDRDYSKRLTDSLKRVTEIQKNLGITREQRSGALDKIDGNIAQIALQLEEKLKEAPEKYKKQLEDELYYESLKKQRPPINVLPPLEKVEALLKVDGKVSANLDSEKISQITEVVTKEVADQRESEREAEREKPKKKDLPDGIDLSR